MAEMKKCEVELKRDSAGFWVARVPSVPGCHTQGRTIDQAMGRIREALSLFVENADRVELEQSVLLPKKYLLLIGKLNEARVEAEGRQAALKATTQKVVDTFVEKVGLSFRDVGALTDMSHQRVQQIVSKKKRRKVSEARV